MMMTGDEEKLINNAEPQAEETKLTKVPVTRCQ